MLSAAENEMLTRVGRGTPMGELMRRYWQPMAAAAVAVGKPATIVDRVPVYASPIGAGFAYWPDV